ncbi:MAG: regulatory protein RecX [Bryobacterales bacterium]|jgi:regulatory protein|nr:regulatory protein RecX [Bryobacterales bacterium]
MKRKPLDEQGLWQYAVRALGARAHSAAEMRTKLMARANRQEDVEGILARLAEYGYLNDVRFAEMVAGTRLETQGFGKARVLRELRQRRVASGTAEEAAARTFAGVDEMELAAQYLQRRILRHGPLLDEPKQLASAYGKLRRAGFPTPVILTVLKRHARDPELLDTFEEPPEETAG